VKIAKLAIAAIAVLALGAGVATASSNGNKFAMSGTIRGETYIMYQNHMALYTYDKDQSGVSNCYDQCAIIWPPAIMPAGTKLGENYTLIKRKDGAMQIAYKGQPLYLYSKDARIGDISGDGVKGVWRVARP